MFSSKLEFKKYLRDQATEEQLIETHCPDCEKIAKYTDGFITKCRKHSNDKWFYDKVLSKDKRLDKILKEINNVK